MNQKVIGATKIQRVTASHAREQYAGLLVEVAPSKLEDVIKGLEEYFAKKPEHDLIQCDVCKGWSTNEVDTCPYCGEAGEVTAAVPPAEAFEEAPVAEPETPASEPSATEITAPAEVLAAATEAPTAIVEGEPKKVDRKKKDKSKKETPAATAPALVEAPVSQFTEKDLDESIERFKAACEGQGAAMYDAGVELKKIRDELWQTRTEGGKPKFKSFVQFCTDELKCAKDPAYRLIRVVENFTKEQFLAFGPGVLKALVAAPKEDHPKLLEMAEQGATITQITEQVAEIREAKGITQIETDATKQRAAAGKPATPAAAGAAARKKESAAITVGLKQEATTIPLYARPKKATDEKREARALADEPWGELEAMNGVKLFFALKENAKGEMVLRVTAKREQDEDEQAAE